MHPPESLRELLVLEDDRLFAEIACPITGILAWPSIRNDVFRLLLGDLLYPTAPIVNLEKSAPIGRIAVSAFRATAFNLRHPRQQSDVLIVGTGAGLVERSGSSFNRYTDYFADLLGTRAWTMEALFGDSWPSSRRSNQRLGSLAFHRLALAARMRTSVRGIHRGLASDLVNVVSRRGLNELGWNLSPERARSLQTLSARRLAAYPTQARYLTRLLNKIKPRVVFLEEGCYGSQAVFNAMARQHGVRVAEFQHGMVTSGHDAYNVAPALASTLAYERTQPNAFLAYGPWWNTQFNAPVTERIAIGNPHRAVALERWRPGPSREAVLVLGDGIETTKSLALATALTRHLPESIPVVFRPHPLERAAARAAGGDVLIDPEPDILASFAQVGTVVGEASTGLFEAVALVPRIFAWDTPKSRFYLGSSHPFDRIADANELAKAIMTPGRGELGRAMTDEVWSDDWAGRLLDYLRGLPPQ